MEPVPLLVLDSTGKLDVLPVRVLALVWHVGTGSESGDDTSSRSVLVDFSWDLSSLRVIVDVVEELELLDEPLAQVRSEVLLLVFRVQRTRTVSALAVLRNHKH